MSWITRCPDCDTVYKVVSEQLHQAQGWLRCGTCQHVFDSAGRIVAADVIPTLTDRLHVGAPQLGRVDLERLLHKESPPSAMPLSDALQTACVTPAVSESSSIAAFEDALQSFKRPDAPATDTGARTSAAEPAFVAPERSRSDKRQGLSRLLVGLLTWVVMGQLLLAFRPVLLTQWPQWGQRIAQWCTTAACRAHWQPPLSLWSLQVQPAVCDGGHCRWAWTLRHSASVSLPVPDLTVTLLNAQGQPVSSPRPAIPVAPPIVLAAGQAWQGALQMDSSLDADATLALLRLVNH